MLSLMLGLTAALSWGVHDFTVRYVSQRSRILPLILVVMICGAVLLAVPALVLGDWERMPAKAWGFAFASGVAYALGALGLYQAFAIGPVRLVAPITGSYPVLSLAWAAIGGAPTHLGQWLAVGAILAGIGAVAAWAAEDNSANTTPSPRRLEAMAWATMGAAGFAATFALGHIGTEAGSELPVLLVARMASVLSIAALMLATRTPPTLHRPHLRLLVLMGLLDIVALGLVLAAGNLPNPAYAAVASSVFGIITILLAWRFLREPIARLQWGGIALVFAGIAYLAL